MTTRWMGRNLWALLCLLPLAFASAASADDLRSKGGCNVNGIDDACDLDCDDETCLKEIEPDVWIVTPGCGMSQDCDSDGIPDECDGQPRTVYYVDADATAGNDTGEDWDNAYVDLKPALDTICDNMVSTCGIFEVWVAEGTYYPTIQNDPDFLRRRKAVRLCENMRVYGGFDPDSDATEWEDRDPAAHPTILSGDIQRDDATAGISDNSYTVVYANISTNGPAALTTFGLPTMVLDGFTIRDGNADDSDGFFETAYGGGIYVYGGRPLIQNCIITDNSARKGGGGAYFKHFRNWSGDLVADCLFDGNTCTHGDGGGLGVEDGPWFFNPDHNGWEGGMEWDRV